MSLVWRIALIAAAILVASMGTMTYFGDRAVSVELTQALQSRSEAVARSLAIQLERILQYGLALEDIEGFEDQLREAVQNYDGLSYALVADAAGQVIYSHTGPDAGDAAQLHMQWDGTAQGARDGRFRDAQAGIKTPGGAQAGRVVVGFRADLVAARVNRIERNALLMALAVFAAGSALLMAALRLFVARPLQRFGSTIEQIRQGGTLAPRVDETGPVEFHSVATSFNRMLGELQAQREAKALADSASHAKSMFLAKMSHEVRTPMNGVLGMLDMLSHTPLDERQQRLAGAAARSGEALLAIINDVLDYAKIEAGKIDLEQVEFSLAELVDDTRAILESSAAAKGLSLDIGISPRVPPVLVGDPLRVRQILWNLLSNAVKFTNAGSVRVQVDAEPGGPVRIEVIDTGIGMPAETLQLVFEPFAQADNSVSRKYGGTGLGLTIARELAQSMGGQIQVKSTPGAGSAFEVRLPLPAGTRPPAASAPAARRRERAPGAPAPRLLIVEDNELNREVVEAMLEGQGFELHTADSGPRALQMMEAMPFDLALVDCSMPGMDGYETTRELRRRERAGGLRRLPVLALTGNVASDARERCDKAGMDDYLSKPCPRQRLIATVQRWLDGGDSPPPAGERAAPPAAARALPGVDPSALAELRALQRPQAPDLVERAIELFGGGMSKLLAQARQAQAALDLDTLERCAHTMASVSLNLGAVELGGLCRQLEARAAGHGDAAALLDRIEGLAAQVERALREQEARI